jgi:preprotein translocase subunit SecG
MELEPILLVIHLIVALGIVAVVLIQPSEAGGFLGNSGTMSNLMAPRRSGDVLTKTTTILAAIFFSTSLLLAILAEHRPTGKSILDAVGTEKPAAVKSEAVPEKEKAPDMMKKEEPKAPKAPVSK